MDGTVVAALIGMGGVILTIAGTLGGTYLGSVLNRRSAVRTATDLAELERLRYAQDRLWDARKESYTAIIAGLRASAKLAGVVDESYSHPELSLRFIAGRLLEKTNRETESQAKIVQ